MSDCAGSAAFKRQLRTAGVPPAAARFGSLHALAEGVRPIAMLNPYAPHIAHELHEITGGVGLLERCGWPPLTRRYVEDLVTYRCKSTETPRHHNRATRRHTATILAQAKADPNTVKYLDGRPSRNYPRRIVTLVVK